MQFSKVKNFPAPIGAFQLVVVKDNFYLALATLFVLSMVMMIFGIVLLADSRLKLTSWSVFAWCAIFFLISLFVHEALHVIAHPKYGFSAKTKIGIGFVGRIPAFWVGYAGWVSCNRAMVIFSAPVVFLGVVIPLFSFFFSLDYLGFSLMVGGGQFLISRTDILLVLRLLSLRPECIYECESGFYVASRGYCGNHC